MNKLVRKAQKGDDKAFIKLFQLYEEDLYRMAFVYVKNEVDALDVVQETAYRAFKNIETIKKPKYVKTWLIRIAITCSLDLLKKNKNVVPLIPDYEQFMGAEADPLAAITLKEMIEKLNEEEKSTVLLRFYEGYSFKEIAETLSVPLGTAKSILYRAMGKMRKEYEEGEKDESYQAGDQ
ncbi:RNA polymerase sigma factor [Rossellomorea oryzaecorticis]|uniref:RNA polymerase sigma factor n=1 Tax=Rossellomorea oryzaecorticis TaxID=1396505 RepID=A0ABW8VL85_9BACI